MLSQILYSAPSKSAMRRPSFWQRLHLDPVLFICLLLLSCAGLFILYSSANQNMALVKKQLIHLSIGFTALFLIAQINPRILFRWTPVAFGVGILLLLLVDFVGHTGKGAQRWLDLGFIRFQPTELIKISLPMMVAWYLSNKNLPPSYRHLSMCLLIIAVPFYLILRQPDLGSSILIACSGFFVLFFAGIRWKLMGIAAVITVSAMPIFWMLMHNYQKQRVLTFLNPERDPLGAGWNIIQSKIAIGSGGLFGKGWTTGSQAHLGFLPEQSTDFIFAVWCEEFGLIGFCALAVLYIVIVIRSFQLGVGSQDTYSRLLSGSIALTFFAYASINIGMVSGLLPIVGLPLPLMSYGGTSVVSLLTSFGIIMSLHTHRRLYESSL